jgi:DNA repair photolyase/3-methyladenine DNA glycosylase AlkC
MSIGRVRLADEEDAMDQILEKLLARPSLQTAQMAGAAVRSVMARDPRAAISGLASWSEHPDPLVRIASGVGLGVMATRDRNALPDALPYIERLANDGSSDVRHHGASAALEQLWLTHADAVTDVVEKWIGGRNDNVREVVVRTIARIATSGQITRPSVLRRFVERGLSIYDRLAGDASPQLRTAIAECVDDVGCLAPDVVSPVVVDWAARDEMGPLRLVAEVVRLPFGATCPGLDLEGAAKKLRVLEAKARTRAARWVRDGVGAIDYLPFVGTEFLTPAKDAALPWTHVADPYRGCQLRCEFCNARSLSEWVGDTPETFVRRVSVVRNAGELLARELDDSIMTPRAQHVVCVGAASDPYQPAEERFEVTREVLTACLAAEHPVILQTRQALVLRDLDVLEALAEKGLVNVLVALQSSDDAVRSRIELGTSTVSERYRAIRMLSTHQVPVGLVLSPIMPGVTDQEDALDEVVRRAGDAGAKWVTAQVLDLRGSAGVKVRLFLEGSAEELLPRYDEMYGASGKARTADDEYVRRITQDVVPGLAAKHGLDVWDQMLTSGRDPRSCLVRK